MIVGTVIFALLDVFSEKIKTAFTLSGTENAVFDFVIEMVGAAVTAAVYIGIVVAFAVLLG